MRQSTISVHVLAAQGAFPPKSTVQKNLLNYGKI